MSHYNFRPIDHDVLITCVKNDYCSNCPLRVGCKIRHGFYSSNDIEYETYIQLAEIYALAKLHAPKDIAAEAADHLRKKRERELRTNPHFSYM